MSGNRTAGPRWYQDIPWRVWYRIRQTALFFLGPAQLDDDIDPRQRLKRERRERYAGRSWGE